MATLALLSLSSSPPFSSHRSLPCSKLSRFAFLSRTSGWGRRTLQLPVICSASEPNQNAESEPEPEPEMSSSSSDLTYKLCAGLGGIGFLETTYLTFLKLTNSDAFCPTGSGGSCGDILNSDYAVVLGNSPTSLLNSNTQSKKNREFPLEPCKLEMNYSAVCEKILKFGLFDYAVVLSTPQLHNELNSNTRNKEKKIPLDLANWK